MPATVIAERIGWRYSIRTLSTRVAELRPIYLPPDPASRTSYVAGEIAQCDFWFPPIRLPVGFGQTRTATQLPVLTMITGYARWASGLLLPTRRAEDLYAGWWRLFENLGAVPRVLVWDGEAAVGRWRPRQPQLTVACQGFRGVLGTKVLICKPGDPEAKGIIEPVEGRPVAQVAAAYTVSRQWIYKLLGACQVLCVTIVVDLDVCGWFCGRSSGVDGVPVLDAVKIVPPVGGCILTAPARRRHGPGWRNGRGVSHRHILGSSRPGKAKLSAP
jgi:transposase